MTSSMLIMKYDKDKDSQLSKKELARLKKSAIKSLIEPLNKNLNFSIRKVILPQKNQTTISKV